MSSGDYDSDDDSWDSDDDDIIEEEEKRFTFDTKVAYLHQTVDTLNDNESLDSKGSISIDDTKTLTSYTSGNDMTRYVLTHCTFDKLHDDEDVYHKSFAEATPENVAAYISRAANVRGAFSLRPRNKKVPAGKDVETMRKRFGYVTASIMEATFAATTQLGTKDVRYPLRRHYKSRFPGANVNRLRETFSTDTMFSSKPAIGGNTCVQLFVGNTSTFTAAFGMKREAEGIEALQDFVNQLGAPDCIRRDNSKMQNSEAWKKYERKMQINSETTEPHNQQMNPAERRIQTVKKGVNALMDRKGSPHFMWFECMLFYIAILNMSCIDRLNGRNAFEVAFGHSIDISAYIQFEWWEPVYYLETDDPSFPNSKEKQGYFCGVAENTGDLMTFKIYVPDTHQIIHRSVLRSAANDDDHPNLRANNPNYQGEPREDDDTWDVIEVEEAANNELEQKIDAKDTSESDTISLDSQPAPLCLSSELGIDDPLLVTATTNRDIPDPADLIGFVFAMKDGDDVSRAKVKEKEEDSEQFVVELENGKKHLMEYHVLLDRYNEANNEEDQIFTYSSILDHRKRNRKWEVLVKWDGIGVEPTWEPLSNLKESDPITIASYAKKKKLTDKTGWRWAKKVRDLDPSRMIRVARRICKAMRSTVKFQFGVQVPRNSREAYDLDRKNGDNLWAEAIRKEVGQLLEFETFKILPRGSSPPAGYQKIPTITTFAVKHDGRRKMRECAGGHVTAPPTEDIYSTVVAPDGVRCVMLISVMNDLTLWGGDVGNAYLNGYTKEKVYTILGPEYGPELEGRIAIVVKSYYGLKTSSARWSEHLADTLRNLGWKACKALNDVWMRERDGIYEFLCVYSDDILVASKNPKAVFDEMEVTYTFKGVGEPEFFLGASVGKVKGNYNDKKSTISLSAHIYLKNLITQLEEKLGVLKCYTIPMDPEYKPELDDSPLLGEEESSMYRTLTGSAQWAITLGRMDIQYPTTVLSRYNMSPREGHIGAMKKVFGYLKGHLKGKIIFDPRPLKVDEVEYFDGSNWQQIYGDVKEDIPHDMPTAKLKPIQLTIYFDASHACDMVTRRSVTGVIVFANSTPIHTFCKKQNTVEDSTYGSEMVAGRIATQYAIQYRYIFRMLGCKIDGPVRLLGDNRGMIQNSALMSSQLKKKHNAISYHRIREAAAMGIAKLGHVRSEANLADILTKPLNGPKLHTLTKELLFRASDSGEC